MRIEFTLHAVRRLKSRKIARSEALEAINYPDEIVKRKGRHYYRKRFDRGYFEVVCERKENHIKVITLYWI